MRVLVCGGRDYTNIGLMSLQLCKLHEEFKFTTVIHGGARGADTMAGVWGLNNNLKVEIFPADWQRDGKAAGPNRNLRMIVQGKPDMIVAFPGGKGTANMMNLARQHHLPLIEIPSS